MPKYLANSAQDANGNEEPKVAIGGHGREHGAERAEDHGDAEDALTTDSVGEQTAKQLRGEVAPEEGAENDALLVLAPHERGAHRVGVRAFVLIASSVRPSRPTHQDGARVLDARRRVVRRAGRQVAHGRLVDHAHHGHAHVHALHVLSRVMLAHVQLTKLQKPTNMTMDMASRVLPQSGTWPSSESDRLLPPMLSCAIRGFSASL